MSDEYRALLNRFRGLTAKQTAERIAKNFPNQFSYMRELSWPDKRSLVSNLYKYLKNNHRFDQEEDTVNAMNYALMDRREWDADRVRKEDEISYISGHPFSKEELHNKVFKFGEKEDSPEREKLFQYLRRHPGEWIALEFTDARNRQFHMGVNRDNIDKIRNLIRGEGTWEDIYSALEGSDVDWISETMMLQTMKVIFRDRITRHGKVDEAGGLFPYMLNSDQHDLEKYQVFPKSAETIPSENCFLYALRMSKKLDESIINSIAHDLIELEYATPKTIEQIAKKYNLRIIIHKTLDHGPKPPNYNKKWNRFVIQPAKLYTPVGKIKMPEYEYENRFGKKTMVRMSLKDFKNKKPEYFSPNVPEIELNLFHDHYFLCDTIQFNMRYFRHRNDPRLAEFSEEMKQRFHSFLDGKPLFYGVDYPIESITVKNSLTLFEELFTIDGCLIPIDNEILDDPAYEPIAAVNDCDYRLYEARVEELEDGPKSIFSRIFSTIPNLYQFGGNLESYMRKAYRGGRVFIKERKLHINERIADFDVNSLYTFAGTKVYIQTGIPRVLTGSISIDKLLSHEFEDGQVRATPERFISQAFVRIQIDSIGVHRNPETIEGLTVGSIHTVELITLRELIKWNRISAHIIDGIYFSGDRDYSIRNWLREIYKIRSQFKRSYQLAKSRGDEEKAKEYDEIQNSIKSQLNRFTGKTAYKQHPIHKFEIPAERYDPLNFYARHFKKFVQSKIEDGEATIWVKKNFTNTFNMINLGATITAMARKIMNSIIYGCQDAGIDVFYSDTDSIFIRYEDSLKIKWPISNELGAFKIDFDAPCDKFEYAEEAIFIGKKKYCLRFSDGSTHSRTAGKNKKLIPDIWEYFKECAQAP